MPVQASPFSGISIHAPPRGATRLVVPVVIFNPISIHAPPRGATNKSGETVHEDFISIHAPPRGATNKSGETVHEDFISIHAPPRGATPRNYHLREATKIFQFTPLREGRRVRHALADDVGDISIHAPPRGATAKDMQFLQIFCSTLTNQHGLTIVPRNLSRLFW